MFRVLRFTQVCLTVAFSMAVLAAPWSAEAQVACVDGVNNQACINAPGSTLGDIDSFNNGSTVNNQGVVTNDITTFDPSSGVTNSGSVGIDLTTFDANSGVTNSGSVGNDLRTFGANSGVTNSGSVGNDLTTFGDSSGVTSSGSVGNEITTFGANSDVTSSGSVGDEITTFGANSGVTSSGSVGNEITTFGANSGVTSSGSVGDEITTFGDNSGVTSSGSVGDEITTFGDNSGVTNLGSVGSDITTFGDNSGVVNSGAVGSGAAGDGIFIFGLNPNLTLLPGSVIQGDLDLSGGGTRTLNVGNGLSVALTFITPPDVINTFGAPFVQLGNQVAVVDPTALSQQDEMLVDLTSGIFNSIHARLSGAGGGASNSFAGMSLGAGSLMQLGSAKMHLGTKDFSPTATRDTGGIWAQAFGGLRNDDASRPAVGSDTEYYGGIAGIDGWLMPGVRVGAFGGGSQAELEVDFNSQDLDADSYFGGAYASLIQNGFFAHLMLTAGETEYDSTRRVANNLAPGGIELARASYDGTFISPELTVGTTMSFGGFALEPSARVRYAHLSVDGYAETGASDNFSVGSRDVELWLGRLQLAMPITSAVGTLSPRIGVEAWSSDDDTISAVLLGQAISFSPGGDDDEVTGFVGATATTNLGPNASAFIDGEIHMDDDGLSRTEARGGVKFGF